jgi:threonyl-tRNA synthetase
VRVQVDHGNDRMPKKIRTPTKAKVPFQFIAGEDDRAAGSVSFRYRDGSQGNGIPIADAIAKFADTIETKIHV